MLRMSEEVSVGRAALADGWADDADVEFERYRVSFTVEHSEIQGEWNENEDCCPQPHSWKVLGVEPKEGFSNEKRSGYCNSYPISGD